MRRSTRSIGWAAAATMSMGIGLPVTAATPAAPAQSVPMLVCGPPTQDAVVGTSAVIACRASVGEAPMASIEIDGEVLSGSVHDDDGTASPADVQTTTDQDGEARFSYTGTSPGTDELCFWMDLDKDDGNLDEGSGCKADADTARSVIRWVDRVDTTVPPETTGPPVTPDVPSGSSTTVPTEPPPPPPELIGEPAVCPTFDFEGEGNLEGWVPDGDAFAAQPTFGDNVASDRVLPRSPDLGGDYWRTAWPIGHHGDWWLGTSERRPSPAEPWGRTRGDAATGTLQSPAFTVSQPYLVFRLGGRGPGQQVQLLVQRPGEADFSSLRSARPDAGTGDLMRTITWDVADFQRDGSLLSIYVSDSSGEGHLNFDHARCSETEPAADPPPPVWGFADLHAHPAAYLGFGGAHDVDQIIWGGPGGRYSDYERDPSRIHVDLPRCDASHHFGGPLSAVTINTVEGRAAGFESDIVVNRNHEPSGPGGFHGWPDFRDGAHQQMHITQIRRAYEGGLRLMVAHVVHNELIDYASSLVPSGTGTTPPDIVTVSDRQAIDTQVCAIRRMIVMNQDWMELALTPSEAREIVADGKLAIILGVEVDSLGQLDPTSTEGVDDWSARGDANGEVGWLHEIGIRHVFPVHFVDNRIGHAAVYEDLFNTLRDFSKRSVRTLERTREASVGTEFFTVDTARGCGEPGAVWGECVWWKFGDETKRAVIDLNTVLGLGWHPIVTTPNDLPDYSVGTGHVNAGGLVPGTGADYIRQLMARGMVIDIDHMADHTIEGLLADGGPLFVGCQDRTDQRCWDQAYPVVSGHTSFREQSLVPCGAITYSIHGHENSDAVCANGSTTFEGYLPKESERSVSQIEAIRRLGGMVAPIPPQGSVRSAYEVLGTTGPVPNNCHGSTMSWAHAYLLAVARMGGEGGVGIGTDFGLLGMPSPRFEGDGDAKRLEDNGVDANPFSGRSASHLSCFASNRTGQVIPQVRVAEERIDGGARYARAAQTNGVRYGPTPSGAQAPSSILPADSSVQRVDLEPYVLPDVDGGEVVTNVNFDGLAHYGLLPDLFQDVRNIGVTPEDLAPLFRSAESYITMWEKAWRVAECDRADAERVSPIAGPTRPDCAGTATPERLDCPSICRHSAFNCGFLNDAHPTDPAEFALPARRISSGPPRSSPKASGWSLPLTVGAAAVGLASATAVAFTLRRRLWARP